MTPTGVGERTTANDALGRLTHRVHAEYLEMPGLSLTLAQAQRLWGIDRRTCERVVVTLVARGFLRKKADGRFVRRA